MQNRGNNKINQENMQKVSLTNAGDGKYNGYNQL